MAELVLAAILAASFAVYGAYKYQAAETNDYNSFVIKANIFESRIRSLEGQLKEASAMEKSTTDLVKSLSEKNSDNEKEIAYLQDHCAKIRDSQISLRESLSSKRPIVKFSQPVPVNIVLNKGNSADAKLVKKVKSQIKELSK